MTTLAESFLADLEDLSDEDIPVKREQEITEVRTCVYIYILTCLMLILAWYVMQREEGGVEEKPGASCSRLLHTEHYERIMAQVRDGLNASEDEKKASTSAYEYVSTCSSFIHAFGSSFLLSSHTDATLLQVSGRV